MNHKDRPRRPRHMLSTVRPRVDSEPLREWWHDIFRHYGHYRCYAVFLVLPSDKETIRYLTDFGRELHLISGKDCLVMMLTRNRFITHFDDEILSLAIDEYISEGYSIQLADLFRIQFYEFPCLIVCNDIRSPNYVAISFKGMAAEEIAHIMRSIFSIVRRAVSQDREPLVAIQSHRNSQELLKKGKTIVSELRDFAGRTLDTVIEAWLRANMK